MIILAKSVTRRVHALDFCLEVFLSRDRPTLVRAYKIYVRPLLEYCSVVWSPWQVGLINAIENVQRCFTRRLIWPEVLPYRERIALLDIELLELRRIKLDLQFCFKILHNLTCINSDRYFKFDDRDLSIRCYDDKHLLPGQFVTDRGLHHFFNRSVILWNSMSYDCRNTDSLNVFKRLLDLQDFNNFLKGHCVSVCF